MNGRRLLLMMSLSVLAGLLPVLVSERSASGAGTLPDGFVQSRVTGGLTDPTTMAFSPDGRLFAAEQGGTLRIVENGRLLETPFLNISGKVDSAGERGLLGVAFDPNFSANKYVYVYYTQEATATAPAHNRVVRFTASGDRAVSSSEKLILRLNNLSSAANHNGGALNFGKDGKLYVAVGENADLDNSQSMDNLLGKMLRINKDGTVPTDNPFYERASGKNRAIWALGLRNPYSFAVQPGTGRIHINDVGAQTWEEINRGAEGANYGLSRYEGRESNPNFRGPIYAYRHGDTATTGCAITGGAFYDPARVRFPPGYVGDYFFADFCSGWIRRLDLAHRTVTPFKGMSDESPVSLQVSRDGSLYFLARGTGSVERIRYVGN
jgi:glucose/arabinose dehydrogenase